MWKMAPLAVFGYSFLLKSRMVNNCLLAHTGPTTSVTVYSSSRPIVLKNSVFHADEKFPTRLVQ
jgi:hypothetical protein